MAKQHKKKQRPSWFQRQIERGGGEEALIRKTPLDIQREAFNIVRDIARNNITKKDFKYLFTMNILSNVRIALFNEQVKYHTYYSSMTYVMQMNGIYILENNLGVAGDNFQKIYNETNTLLTAYNVAIQSIDSLIAAVQFNYPNDEARDLYYMNVYDSIQNHLSRFRYIL